MKTRGMFLWHASSSALMAYIVMINSMHEAQHPLKGHRSDIDLSCVTFQSLFLQPHLCREFGDMMIVSHPLKSPDYACREVFYFYFFTMTAHGRLCDQ